MRERDRVSTSDLVGLLADPEIQGAKVVEECLLVDGRQSNELLIGWTRADQLKTDMGSFWRTALEAHDPIPGGHRHLAVYLSKTNAAPDARIVKLRWDGQAPEFLSAPNERRIEALDQLPMRAWEWGVATQQQAIADLRAQISDERKVNQFLMAQLIQQGRWLQQYQLFALSLEQGEGQFSEGQQEMASELAAQARDWMRQNEGIIAMAGDAAEELLDGTKAGSLLRLARKNFGTPVSKGKDNG